jgi:signal peptidase I
MIDYLLTIVIAVGIIGLTLKWFISNFAIGKVDGISMLPTFNDGEIFLVRKTNYEIKVGEIYLFEVEGYGYLIKRLNKIQTTPYNGHTSYFILGDNSEDSIDSRDFGYLPENSVKGKIIKLQFWRS